MDRLDAMQVLLTVVDQGSLSAGSRKLNVPLPSVSRKVAELERHLGTQLLIRTSRKIQLTNAGRDYVDSARHIIAEIKEAELRAAGEYQVPRGQLTITASLQLGDSLVMPLAHEFMKQHPEIVLNVLLLDRRVQLVDENVDVAVRVGELEDSSLYAVKVGEVCMATCASPDYVGRKGRPDRPDELSDHDGVIFGNVNETPWPYFCDGQRFEGLPNIRLRGNAASAAVAAAVQGLGITRVLSFMVADELRSGALIRLLDNYDGGSFPVHLVYVRQALLPIKVRAFLDWMTPRLRQTLKEPPNACA